MNFSRSLLGTMLVAIFGAIVAAGTIAMSAGEHGPGALGGVLAHDAALAAQAFRRVFFVAAATLTVAFIAIAVLEQRPLAADDEREIE
jgi:hypothetical protein